MTLTLLIGPKIYYFMKTVDLLKTTCGVSLYKIIYKDTETNLKVNGLST